MTLTCYTSVTQAEPKPNHKNMTTDAHLPVLLVLGDSLSAAYGLQQEQGWVSLLSEKLQAKSIKVVNASISGETTSGGKARLPALLKQYQPKWVIIELGANDALRGQNLSTTRNNLQTLVFLSQRQAARVLLLGIRLPTNYGPAYDKQLQKTYRNVAKQNGTLFDPFFLETVALEPGMMQEDGLHPNAPAQPIILKRLQPLIDQLIQH